MLAGPGAVQVCKVKEHLGQAALVVRLQTEHLEGVAERCKTLMERVEEAA